MKSMKRIVLTGAAVMVMMSLAAPVMAQEVRDHRDGSEEASPIDCTWKNLWCMLHPLFEDALTEDSSGSADVEASELREQGYTGVRAGVNSFICKKEGKPSYICDNAGQCVSIKNHQS